MEQAHSDIQLLTVKQTAEVLRCAPATVYELIRTGELVVTRIGREKGYRIDAKDLAQFVTSRKFSFQPQPRQAKNRTLRHLRL